MAGLSWIASRNAFAAVNSVPIAHIQPMVYKFGFDMFVADDVVFNRENENQRFVLDHLVLTGVAYNSF